MVGSLDLCCIVLVCIARLFRFGWFLAGLCDWVGVLYLLRVVGGCVCSMLAPFLFILLVGWLVVFWLFFLLLFLCFSVGVVVQFDVASSNRCGSSSRSLTWLALLALYFLVFFCITHNH